MELIELKADAREETGKGPARRMRGRGIIPGVVYGLRRDTLHVSVPRLQLERVYGSAENVLIDLDVPGEEKEEAVAAVVKEIQRDPVTQDPLSVDFQWISLEETIEVEVPIQITGHAPGVDEEGGVVQMQLHTIPVSCLPTDIPQSITTEIEGMEIGDALFVEDLPEVEGVTYIPEPDEVVLSIAPPITEEELEARIDEEMLESLVDLEVGEEVVEAEELIPEAEEEEVEERAPSAPEGAQVDVQEADEEELEGPA
ncbi:MAG: 50S ribosomal protein L25 [Armatimonadota bacterium]|nr:50S ribosomal protein L25 [Armatimonadota bacterium]